MAFKPCVHGECAKHFLSLIQATYGWVQRRDHPAITGNMMIVHAAILRRMNWTTYGRNNGSLS